MIPEKWKTVFPRDKHRKAFAPGDHAHKKQPNNKLSSMTIHPTRFGTSRRFCGGINSACWSTHWCKFWGRPPSAVVTPPPHRLSAPQPSEAHSDPPAIQPSALCFGPGGFGGNPGYSTTAEASRSLNRDVRWFFSKYFFSLSAVISLRIWRAPFKGSLLTLARTTAG